MMETTEMVIRKTEVQEAIQRLQKSERGRQALASLQQFINNGALGLDGMNQDAVLTILLAEWGPLTGIVNETLGE